MDENKIEETLNIEGLGNEVEPEYPIPEVEPETPEQTISGVVSKAAVGVAFAGGMAVGRFVVPKVEKGAKALGRAFKAGVKYVSGKFKKDEPTESEDGSDEKDSEDKDKDKNKEKKKKK